MSSLPRRIAVVGRAGAGKTTVALRLGEALGLQVVHLDRLFWGPGWRPLARETFESGQAAAVAGDAWVIDGGYLTSRGWQERLRRADVVVLVEAPLAICLWRIVRRSVGRRAARRPELPDGCDETMNLAFLRWMLGWAGRHRDLARAMKQANPELRVVTKRWRDDLARLVEVLSGIEIDGIAPSDVSMPP